MASPESVQAWERSSQYQAIVAALFASSGPLTTDKLAELLALTVGQVSDLVIAPPVNDDFAFIVQQQGESLQLVTNPRYGFVVRAISSIEGVQELTKAAKETLAVIAYKQPIDRTTLENIRGLDCRRTLATLTQKGLVQQSGDVPDGGDPRAFYYEVSWKFLEHFGLKHVGELKAKMGA